MKRSLAAAGSAASTPTTSPRCLQAYSSAFDCRGPFKAEYRLHRHDGEYRWLLDTGTPMHDEHGRFVGYIGSSVDITERKTVERAREAVLAAERAARSDAERANELKDEFLSILSHELRTPLNAVFGWVHLLRTSLVPNGQLGRGLNVIERNTRLQSRMVDDLLDMSGVIAGKMRIEPRPVTLAIGSSTGPLKACSRRSSGRESCSPPPRGRPRRGRRRSASPPPDCLEPGFELPQVHPGWRGGRRRADARRQRGVHRRARHGPGHRDRTSCRSSSIDFDRATPRPAARTAASGLAWRS